MPFNQDFNAAKFLYYNPELAAFSNVLTNADAIAWALSNDTNGMASNDDGIPVNFDSLTFVSDYKSTLDASILNQTIKTAMLAEGFSSQQLNVRGKYVSTIYQDARLVAENEFRFNFLPAPPEQTFSISNSNLNVGDQIKLLHVNTGIYEYAFVTTIVDPNTFGASNPRKEFTNVGDVYTVVGIRVWDLERLARINFLRGMSPPPSVPPADAFAQLDTSFNPELYRLLYPDASRMNDLETYIDYVNRKDNNDFRIGRAGDIPVGSNDFKSEFNYVNVDYRLTLDEVCAMQWGDKYVYGISTDSVTRSAQVSLINDKLITERAIKQYVDRSFDEVAVFNDITVNGTTTLNGPVFINNSLNINDLNISGNLVVRDDLEVNGSTILEDLEVRGTSILHGGTRILDNGIESNYIESCELSNVYIKNAIHSDGSLFKTEVYLESNLYFNDSLIGPRIGIGPALEVVYNSNVDGLYDAALKNVIVKGSLDVGSNLPEGSLALSVHGFIHADNLNFISDKRLKEVYSTYSTDTDNSGIIIDALTPVIYAYKNNLEARKIGFIADEVEKVLPEAVIKMSTYEMRVDIPGRVVDCMAMCIVLESTYSHGFCAGDALHIAECGWVEIHKVWGGNTYTLLLRGCTKLNWCSNRTVFKIDAVNLKNVKTLDYPVMVAALWAAVKDLRKCLLERSA